MNVDESDFGRRYAHLSEEGLLSIDREDLIDTARQCYDQELARRGLQNDRTVIVGTPSRELIVSGLESNRVARTFGHRLPAPVRVLSALIGNFLVAEVGTGISEGEFYNFYHPVSFQGGYAKELILSVAVAFLLGGFVYYRWQSGAAKWMWIVGVCGLIWLLVGSRGQTPFIPDWLRAWAVLSFVSVRVIAYSAGAWLSAKLIIGSPTDLEPQETESSPEGSDAP
jgi:hypothetical protein